MSGQLIPFAQSGGLPAHIAAAFGDGEGNTEGRVSIDQLSYRGKVWRLVLKGKEHALTTTTTDPETGEINTNPLPVVKLVVLDFNKQRSRSYYEGDYVDGKNAVPICYSADGVAPDASVKNKQAPSCATCPHAVKGSKMTASGKPTTACAPFKRVAVVPAQKIGDHALLLLKLAQTSVWDKDADGKDGWYAWDQYIDMLRSRGAKHSCMVETRAKFDINVPYPKLLFSASRWLDADEIAAAKARLASEEDLKTIETILEGRGNDGVSGQPVAPTDSPAPAAAPVAQSAANPVSDANAKAMADLASMMDDAVAPAPVAAAPKAPPKAPKAAPPAPAWPPEGWTQHPEDPEYWFNDAEEVITETELRARVTPAAPAAPKVPKAPAKKTTAKTVEKVKAEPVDDAFTEATAPAPAAAATPITATPVQSGTPADLSALLDGWDA